MKNIINKIILLLGRGCCTPKIAQIAQKLKEPATTIHYNIKKLEKDGVVRGYKAVFNYRAIGKGFCTFCLINLSPDEYGNPERIALDLAKFDEIESVDVITGDWELILKIRTRDQDEYYAFLKQFLSRKGIANLKTLTSLKQVKSEFTQMD